MSMLGMQANELRGYALSVRNIALRTTSLCHEARRDLLDSAARMEQAADTIEGLRKQVAKCQIAELKADYDTSRYFELFGTPERAARTLESMSLDSSIWCRYDAEGQLACKACPYEFDYYGCYDSMPLLEWLRGDA